MKLSYENKKSRSTFEQWNSVEARDCGHFVSHLFLVFAIVQCLLLIQLLWCFFFSMLRLIKKVVSFYHMKRNDRVTLSRNDIVNVSNTHTQQNPKIRVKISFIGIISSLINWSRRISIDFDSIEKISSFWTDKKRKCRIKRLDWKMVKVLFWISWWMERVQKVKY